MREFLPLVPRSFGLDFSDRSLKLCLLDTKGRNAISFGEVDVPQGIVENGEVKNAAELGRAIREGVRTAHGATLPRYCVGALPDEKAFVQVVQLPVMPSVGRKEIRSAIAFQAETYIPYPIDTVYFDFEVLPFLGVRVDHSDVLIAAIPRAVVEPYMEAARIAGITFSLLELESFSLCRALIRGGFSPVPVLVLDIGATRTGFVVFFGSSVRFTASIGVSAESCKTASGLSDLVKHVKRYLLYYNAHAPHVHAKGSGGDIDTMIVCGGGSMVKGIAPALSSELDIAVRVGDPWVNIHWPRTREIPPVSREESLRYAVALGLALKATRLAPFL
ncbi:MAG: pilus assembly protein PilM [Candidatus Wildermuthbacteria bacterium]|nr:pilus assembly protein PilM [Candidatus Wildermuthbacteria bacterium]